MVQEEKNIYVYFVVHVNDSLELTCYPIKEYMASLSWKKKVEKLKSYMSVCCI